MQILFGFLAALVLMALPFGMIFVPAGAMFILVYLLISAGLFLALLFYFIMKGDLQAALGALFVPLIL